MIKLYKKSLLLFVLLWVSLSNATTIVLIRNENGVFIGADSRIVNERGQSLGSECKITRFKNIYFVHAGLGSDALYGFDIQDIAKQAFSSKNSLDEKVRNFENTLKSQYKEYLEKIRTARSEVYFRIKSGTLNIEAAIAGQNTDGAFFKAFKFSAEGPDDDIKISMPVQYSCPGDCQGGKVVAMLGQMSHTQEIVARRAHRMMRDPISAINFIINREIDYNPRVGPPITILHIGHDTTQWIQHSDFCREH